MLGVKAFAYDMSSRNADGVPIYYNKAYTDHGVELTVTYGFEINEPSYTGVVVIPEEVISGGKTMKVVAIGEYAFSCCDELTSVTIPNGVTSIGNGAFRYCYKLISANIPNSVTYIGQESFSQCALTFVTIPNSVTKIGKEAFIGNNLNCIYSMIEEPYNITSIVDWWVFEEITLYVPVGTIDKYKAMNGWKKFENIKENTIFTELNSDGLTLSYDYCDNGSELKVVSSAYSGLEYEGAVNIPEEVTHNGKTFKVTTIGDNAFTYCDKITSVTIPSTITNVGYAPFSGCSELASIQVAEGNPVYDSRNNCNAIIETVDNRINQGCMNTVIPEDVTSIGICAFCKCTKLKAITIPNSVTFIGYCAFQDCSGLTTITIPSSVNNIDANAFIGIELKSVVSLIEEPFVIDGIFYNWNEPGTFSEYTCKNATLYVPFGTIDKYKATYGWKDFNNIEELEPTDIHHIEAPAPDAPCYDLNGVRITQPRKGVFIQNCKKVMMSTAH